MSSFFGIVWTIFSVHPDTPLQRKKKLAISVMSNQVRIKQKCFNRKGRSKESNWEGWESGGGEREDTGVVM